MITEFGESSRVRRHLAKVGDDPGYANDVVPIFDQLALETLQVGKIQQRAGRRNVVLDHHQAPRAMEHAQRKAALSAGNLVVVELHGIDGAAAIFVILCVRAENGTQQNSRLRPLWMGLNLIHSKC
jgi:hypothetical protein